VQQHSDLFEQNCVAKQIKSGTVN